MSFLKNYDNIEMSFCNKLDSRLMCNAMGHPDCPKNIHYNTLGMHELFLLKKKGHNSVENYHIGNNLHLC